MRGSFNFRGNTPYTQDNVGRALDEVWRAVSNIQTGKTITQAISAAISGGSGGGSAPKFEYRYGEVAVSAGAQTITFSSSMSTTDYKVIAFLVDSDGATTLLKSPTTKTLSSISYTFDFAGTVIYFVAPTQ